MLDAARGRTSSTSRSRWSPVRLPAGSRGAAAQRGGGRRRVPARARRPAQRRGRGGRPRRPAPLATPRSGSAIKRAADEFFARAGRAARSVSLESGDPYLIRCLVSDGFGAALLPASLTRRQGPPVETRPLRPAGPAPGRAALARAGGGRSAAAEAFDRLRPRRARLTLHRSPTARVAGRDPVARPGVASTTSTGGRGGGLAEELELARAERVEGGLDRARVVGDDDRVRRRVGGQVLGPRVVGDDAVEAVRRLAVSI